MLFEFELINPAHRGSRIGELLFFCTEMQISWCSFEKSVVSVKRNAKILQKHHIGVLICYLVPFWHSHCKRLSAGGI